MSQIAERTATEQLEKLQAGSRVANLKQLAVQPAEKQYQLIESSCGHSWRRERLTGGGFGPWERKDKRTGLWKAAQ